MRTLCEVNFFEIDPAMSWEDFSATVQRYQEEVTELWVSPKDIPKDVSQFLEGLGKWVEDIDQENEKLKEVLETWMKKVDTFNEDTGNGLPEIVFIKND
jgi:hypothetical protein